jgi:hypothetical protein
MTSLAHLICSTLPAQNVPFLIIECRRAQVQFAVGFKLERKAGHAVVDAEDALIARPQS